MSDFDIENFPTSESAKRMMSTISEDFYRDSYVMKWMQQVMGMEWDDAIRIIEEELPKQFFPETATWGLKYHEIKWQLPIREHLSYEERRRAIYEKRDSCLPMTPYYMEQNLEKILGLEVHVEDIHDAGRFGHIFEHPNIFHVTVIGNSSLDTENVCALLDRLKQSHTTYTIEILDNRYEVAHCTYTAIVPQTKKTYEMEVL